VCSFEDIIYNVISEMNNKWINYELFLGFTEELLENYCLAVDEKKNCEMLKNIFAAIEKYITTENCEVLIEYVVKTCTEEKLKAVLKLISSEEIMQPELFFDMVNKIVSSIDNKKIQKKIKNEIIGLSLLDDDEDCTSDGTT